MSNSSPSLTPLTGQAMQRLRRLAEGNGMEPSSITLMQGEEKIFDLEGVMTLAPLCEAETRQYFGPPSGKVDKVFPDSASLHNEITQRQQSFRQNPNWIGEVKQELQTSPGKGWGLDGAKVTLANRAAALAAAIPCPQCHGNRFVACGTCRGHKFVPCIQCRGHRQEYCYNCAGSGVNPQQQNQPCPVCQGRRMMTCRLCRGTGQTPCATCGGHGGTACTACKGSGQMTEEAHLIFGATTHFQIKSSGLPSGLRRGLDRLGIANLTKGLADIETVTPKKEGGEDDFPPPGEDSAPQSKKPPDAAIHYVAHLPFADLRVDFGGKKAVVSSLGKKGVLIDVPPFLDEALAPWRGKLANAARGKDTIHAAIKGRAIHDALMLELQGNGNAKEFRRYYPVGISGKVVDEIILNTRKAVKRATVFIRAGAAAFWAFLSTAFFGGCYYAPFPLRLVAPIRRGEMLLDFVPPVAAAALGWFMLSVATRFVLRKGFPDAKIARIQKPGMPGFIMIAAILLLWLVILMFSPARPVWMPVLIH